MGAFNDAVARSPLGTLVRVQREVLRGVTAADLKRLHATNAVKNDAERRRLAATIGRVVTVTLAAGSDYPDAMQAPISCQKVGQSCDATGSVRAFEA